MSANTNHETALLTGLLNAVNLTTYGVEKAASFPSDDVIDGEGILICEITNRQQAYPNQPIYFVSVSLWGMTYASVDEDQATIRQMYDDVMKSVQVWTPATLTTTVGLTIDGILQITTAAIVGNGKEFRFTVDFRLAMSNVTF